MCSTERHHMVKSALPFLTTLCGCCVNSGHTGGAAQFPSPEQPPTSRTYFWVFIEPMYTLVELLVLPGKPLTHICMAVSVYRVSWETKLLSGRGGEGRGKDRSGSSCSLLAC